MVKNIYAQKLYMKCMYKKIVSKEIAMITGDGSRPE